MSGGHFDYQQYRMHDVAEQIKEAIERNDTPDEYDYCANYSKETLNKFRKAIELLTEAEAYAQRIDWLLSGDDSEESFHRRLKEELDAISEQR